MRNFAAVTSAARSRAPLGAGDGDGAAFAMEYTDAQASHIETKAKADPLVKATLID